LRAETDINAPVEKVWRLVSDFNRMPDWSPQCRLMKAFGPVRHGTRTFNINRRNRLFWATTSTVTGSSRSGSWRFGSPPNGTIWSYEPEPTADGTRVVESRHAENGVKPLSDLAVSTLMGGVGGFEGESVAGMSASLARIKAAAEG
jgi:Polyketide cyclase / dehydrase and lipid transport